MSICHALQLYQNGARCEMPQRQNFVPLGEEVSFKRGHQRKVPLAKRIIFSGIGSSKCLKGDTDLLLVITSTSDKLFSVINIADLERL